MGRWTEDDYMGVAVLKLFTDLPITCSGGPASVRCPLEDSVDISAILGQTDGSGEDSFFLRK